MSYSMKTLPGDPTVRSQRTYDKYDRQQAEQLQEAINQAGLRLRFATEDGTPKGRVWVTVVHVEQAYGGPEEGGWWYDAEYAMKSVNVPLSMVARFSRNLLKAYFYRNDPQPSYNFHSRGKVVIRISIVPFSFERPYYC